MKVICMYLPQYHQIPENDKWWGEGYTEWNAVRNAKKLYKKHEQPRIPFNNNYYDLNLNGKNTWEWQASLANQYGIYGFCIYHYWFKGKQLLERPMEILLNNPDINIRYSICWANETWKRNWYGLKEEVLMEQTYGVEEDWIAHFNYLLQFFKDPRYIKVDNKPVINIYRSYAIDDLKQMIEVWNVCAKEQGFDGVYIVSAKAAGKQETRDELVSAYYYFEPGYSTKNEMGFIEKINYYTPIFIRKSLNKFRKNKMLERIVDSGVMYNKIEKRNYDIGKTCFPGTFPDWDNTPRRGYLGMVYKNVSAIRFKKNLLKLRDVVKNQTPDFVYVNAWNEWGEGAYLEPDEKNRYDYLDAIRQIKEK